MTDVTTAQIGDTTQTKPAPAVQLWLTEAENALAETVWPQQQAVCRQVTQRVLAGFTRYQVGEEHFASVTGYGHDDLGREVTDNVFAHALQAEAALVRAQLVSGTHAIAVALNACLTAGDLLLSVTGKPYDTLEEVIGKRGESTQSLKAKGVAYDEIDYFKTEGTFGAAEQGLIKKATVILIQRSAGYSLRPKLSQEKLADLIQQIKTINSAVTVFVDNCYGEFTDVAEPTTLGADLMAGSLIKNPGGGIVPTGGYIAGRADLIARCGEVLTCPGIGEKGGYTFDLTRTFLQGLYLAPGMVQTAMQGMTLAAYVFEKAGYAVLPAWHETGRDIIQPIVLGSKENMITFCKVLQSFSPVNSKITPVPSGAPGYADQLIMAGGTFIDGATLELSADGPLRPPYVVFFQGGLNYAHTRVAVEAILSELI